jgi:hypothetical protein
VSAAIPPGAFVAGCLLLIVTLACTAAAAQLVVSRRLGHLRGPPRAVAFATLMIAGTIAVHLIPLALGILTRGTVLAASAALALASRCVPAAPAPAREDEQAQAAARSGALSRALAAVACLVTLAYWIGFLQKNAAIPVVSVDTLGFHLPGVIRFIQTGTLWHTAQYLPSQAQANYPQYGDLLLLAAVLPWHSVALVRYVDPLLLAVTALAVYAIARELRAPTASAVLASAALLAIRPVLGPALPDVMTDPAFLAGFGAGVLFLMRHWRTGRRAELVLCAVGLGIALGTKWYGLTDVPALVAIWLIAGLVSGRRRDAMFKDAGVLVAVVALAGGVWMLRNLILTGNPVFDYKLSILGATIFPAPPATVRSSIGFSLAHYLGEPSVLRRYVWPVFREDFGLAGAAIVVGAAAAAGLSLIDRQRLRPRQFSARLALLALASLALAVVYVITPYSAQGVRGAPVMVAANTRYAAPALLLATPLLACALGRLRRSRPIGEATLLALTVVDVRRYLPSGAGHVLLGALVVIAVAVAYRWWSRALHAPPPRPRIALGAGAAAVLIALGALGYHYQRLLAGAPYTPSDPVVDYVLAHAPAHSRIGLTGEWLAQGVVPVAPLFGPRLENHVDYVGRFVQHRLEQYDSAASFESALRRGHYPLLVVGTGFPPRPDPVQEQWARAVGYSPVIATVRLVLMRRSGA